MARLSDNYYLRHCYFDTETVPTQSVMINKMSSLAKVYFKSMNRKLKVLAGFEPLMKGGGKDWFIPPKEVLDGRLVMKPVANATLKELSFIGIGNLGQLLVEQHHKRMEAEKNRVLLENDAYWKTTIEASCREQWDKSSKQAANANTVMIQHAFQEFTTMYTRSVAKIEALLHEASIKEIQAMRDQTFDKMQALYKKLLNDQATMLYDRYTKKLDVEKEKRKSNFINQVELTRSDMGKRIHDIKLEKHIVVEKLRQLQESLNLACQVYVALKERETCQKEMALSQHKQQKKIKAVKEKIAMKEFEIHLAIEKEKRCEELNIIWKKKVCQVVKKFQMFASYCLQELPEQGEFFIDMEKLMMLQLSEVLASPLAESIFEVEEPKFHTPVAKPHPFYLFCDKGHKPQIDQDLCPKHCTSSASQLPVVVVNKRLIYAACDNFEKYTDKITEFIHGRRGEDIDFEDTHIYQHDVPVKVTSSTQLLNLKLQSSLMQVLQKELPNVRKVPTTCCICGIPYCFCSPSPSHSLIGNAPYVETQKSPSLKSIPVGKMIKSRSEELAHNREPKWESYMDYVKPTKCACGKRAKKHLEEHLPAYMRQVSTYVEPSLPHYERCPLNTLKIMVKKAQGRVTPPLVERLPSRTHDISTQYSDQEFDYLCTCFSDEEVIKFYREIAKSRSMSEQNALKVVGDDLSSTHLNRRTSSFALECAQKLKRILDEAPELEEIFKIENCDYASSDK